MPFFYIGYAITTIALLLSVFYLTSTLRAQAKHVIRLSKYTELALTLSVNPLVKPLFIKLAGMSDSELKDADVKEMVASEALSAVGLLIEEMRVLVQATPDPEEKVQGEKVLKELESMTTLMSTIDNKSSPEYMSSVLSDILASIKKLRE